jgi:hypothetical protein
MPNLSHSHCVLCCAAGAVTFLFLLFTPFGVDLLFRKFKPASVREAERQAAKVWMDGTIMAP